MTHSVRARAGGAIALLVSVLSVLPSAVGTAEAAPSSAAVTTADLRTPRAKAGGPLRGASSVPADERSAVLGRDYRTSGDRVVVGVGDARGFHLLTARKATGYSWSTVATLAEPGVDTDRWIGNYCTTPDGRSAVVAYMPRQATNRESYFDRGALVATVDLASGRVTKIPLSGTIAYFSPSCGPDDRAAVTSFNATTNQTRVVLVDIPTGKRTRSVVVPGQLTSATPTRAGVLAADGNAVVKVLKDGSRRIVALEDSTPFRLVADRSGGLAYMVAHRDGTGAVRLLPSTAPGTRASTVATGPLDRLGLVRSTSGRPVLTGDPSTSRRVTEIDSLLHLGTDVSVSTTGALVVSTLTVGVDLGADPTLQARPVALEAVATESGRALGFVVRAGGGAAAGTELHPSLRGSGTGPSARAGSSTDPVEAERTCSVPRNDPLNQVLQPKPRQIEWAVDQAVRSSLNFTRPANWNNLQMPSYSPQGLFPSIPLSGGGHVPAQVFLAIIAQESNMWQSTGQVVPGNGGNPLVGNFYGREIYDGDTGNDWDINFDDADCGYGVAQVTDGMRLAGQGPNPYPYQTQRAVALDFAVNVAAGLRILQDKWNITRDAGLTINNGDPSKIENWFYAVWAYNTGFYPESAKASNQGAWGVGWSNNPANPKYPANRAAFLEKTYADAANPQRWPYPEKIMGWAGHPVEILESPDTLVAGYRAAYWNGGEVVGVLNRANAKPPLTQFCDASNSCEPGAKYTPDDPSVVGEPAGPCNHRNSANRIDLRCWYHQASTWKDDCSSTCGNELLRFDPGYAYQANGNAYPPNCSTAGLPAGALIIDDLPTSAPIIRPGCTRTFQNSGTFSLSFAANQAGAFPSKVDFHQLSAGFAGHFWFAHTRVPGLRQGSMEVKGTWTLNRPLDQWARVLVHLPDHGAHTQQATYSIDTGHGVKRRVILQKVLKNSWVSLGVFRFTGTPRVTLTSNTYDGDGGDGGDNDNSSEDAAHEKLIESEDVAYDAIAVQPLPRKPDEIIVALGDSYSSGEGASSPNAADYYAETDSDGDDVDAQNACHRSRLAWSRRATIPGTGDSIGDLADRFSPKIDYAFVACSGAETEQLMPYFTAGSQKPKNAFGEQWQMMGTNGELSQLDRGFLDETTTLVTLSIGGNDAGFAGILQKCIVFAGLRDCYKPDFMGNQPASKVVPNLIKKKVEDSVVKVLAEIHEKAPKAKVLLMGYPRLFEKRGRCMRVITTNIGISGNEADWLNEMSDLLAKHLDQAVDRANKKADRRFVWFSDPRGVFDGKAVCGSPETVHAIVKRQTPGESRRPVSQQSFHPKPSGTVNYAAAMNHALTEMGI